MTLPELTLAAAIFSVIGLLAYQLLHMAWKSYHRISGHEDAVLQLKRAMRQMESDLLATNFNNVTVADVPPSLGGGGKDGSALACLTSAVNGTGPVASTLAGSPYWQRNVLYYLVVPAVDPCPGGVDPEGFDDRCPHKILMRKVVDVGSVTNVSYPVSPEVNLTSFGPYLTRPNGVDFGTMWGEPGISRVEIAAMNLLSFVARKEPDPNSPEEVKVTLRALNLEQKSKIAVGSAALYAHPSTVVLTFSVFPRNSR